MQTFSTFSIIGTHFLQFPETWLSFLKLCFLGWESWPLAVLAKKYLSIFLRNSSISSYFKAYNTVDFCIAPYFPKFRCSGFLVEYFLNPCAYLHERKRTNIQTLAIRKGQVLPPKNIHNYNVSFTRMGSLPGKFFLLIKGVLATKMCSRFCIKCKLCLQYSRCTKVQAVQATEPLKYRCKSILYYSIVHKMLPTDKLGQHYVWSVRKVREHRNRGPLSKLQKEQRPPDWNYYLRSDLQREVVNRCETQDDDDMDNQRQDVSQKCEPLRRDFLVVLITGLYYNSIARLANASHCLLNRLGETAFSHTKIDASVQLQHVQHLRLLSVVLIQTWRKSLHIITGEFRSHTGGIRDQRNFFKARWIFMKRGAYPCHWYEVETLFWHELVKNI